MADTPVADVYDNTWVPWNADDFPDTPPDFNSKYYPLWIIFQEFNSNATLEEFYSQLSGFMTEQGETLAETTNVSSSSELNFNNATVQSSYAKYVKANYSPEIFGRNLNLDSYLKFGLIINANDILVNTLQQQKSSLETIEAMLQSVNTISDLYSKLKLYSPSNGSTIPLNEENGHDTTYLLKTNLTDDDIKTLGDSYNTLYEHYNLNAGIESTALGESDFGSIKNNINTMLFSLKPYLANYLSYSDGGSTIFSTSSLKKSPLNEGDDINDNNTDNYITSWQNDIIHSNSKDATGKTISTPPSTGIRSAQLTLQTANDNARETIRESTFFFEEFYKLAASLLAQIDKVNIKIGSNIDK